jgi:hypothetical protein
VERLLTLSRTIVSSKVAIGITSSVAGRSYFKPNTSPI